MDELELIREYAAVFGKGTNYHYYIFSKGGFTDGLLQAQERGEVQLLTLADIFEYAIKLDDSNEYNYYCPDRKVWEEIEYFQPEAG